MKSRSLANGFSSSRSPGLNGFKLIHISFEEENELGDLLQGRWKFEKVHCQTQKSAKVPRREIYVTFKERRSLSL
jgi:hypothetical protein